MLSVLLFGPVNAQGRMLDQIVAVVNEDVITLSLLNNKLRIEDYSMYSDETEARHAALEDLIEWKLMLQEAERYGKSFVLEEDIRREREKRIAQLPPGIDFEETLHRLGLTIEDVNENIREQILIEQMSFSKFFSGISDEESAEYYEEHASLYRETPVRWEGVYVPVDPNTSSEQRQELQEHAHSVLRALVAGVPLSRFAQDAEVLLIQQTEHSTLEDLIPALRNPLSRLTLGEWNHIIETPIGFYIIRPLARLSPVQKPFEQVKDEIANFLIQQQIRQRRRRWLDQAKQDADIRILDPELAAIPPGTQIRPIGP